MYLITDVDYRSDGAYAAGILFENKSDEKPLQSYLIKIQQVEEYVPGEFYKRELPCLMRLIDQVKKDVKIDTIIVDGHTWLSSQTHKGLGAYLYFELKGITPVIGIAKNRFYNGCATEIFRGESSKPLYITSVGVENDFASNFVRNMHGPYRLPTMVKSVDTLCRKT